MRHLAPAAPKTKVKYAQVYLNQGFGGANATPQVFFELKTAASMSFGASTDKAGGFVQPDLPVRGLSRTLGTVGEIDDLVNKPPAQKFNPQKYLDGVIPKLFGLFDLVDILKAVGLDGAPNFITEQLDRIASLLADLDQLKGALTTGVARRPTMRQAPPRASCSSRHSRREPRSTVSVPRSSRASTSSWTRCRTSWGSTRRPPCRT
ncbi:MAG: hypothetical protein R2712_03855 [Vicinamibacterales bacterium]